MSPAPPRSVPDQRAKHYWDGEKLVGTAYQPFSGLPAAAWDTWMLFDRDAVWRGDTPPSPRGGSTNSVRVRLSYISIPRASRRMRKR